MTTWLDLPPGTGFPMESLPFGRYQRPDGATGAGFAIGDHVLDIEAAIAAGLLRSVPSAPITWAGFDVVVGDESLDLSALRTHARALLSASDRTLRDHPAVDRILLPRSAVEPILPADIPAFVDFYSGIHHASNVGRMFRPDQPPLLPNYRHIPIGYNGRASSVLPTGTPIPRPNGQVRVGDDVLFRPTQELDFELEMGFFLAEGTALGETLEPDLAEGAMAGLVLVNDWSARDLQRWEYQPLGPFLAKSFATTISPWVVPLEALEPFRVEGAPQDPPPLPYLRTQGLRHFDIELEVLLRTDRMTEPQPIARSNAKHLYWSFVQQLVHQSSNGTPLEPGDLYASGTISGPLEGQFGSLLEISWKGTRPIKLDETGETRTFLQDGDTLILRGWAEREGLRVSFGEAAGTVFPAYS